MRKLAVIFLLAIIITLPFKTYEGASVSLGALGIWGVSTLTPFGVIVGGILLGSAIKLNSEANVVGVK